MRASSLVRNDERMYSHGNSCQIRPMELPSCIVNVPSAVPHCVSSPPMPSPSSSIQSLQENPRHQRKRRETKGRGRETRVAASQRTHATDITSMSSPCEVGSHRTRRLFEIAKAGADRSVFEASQRHQQWHPRARAPEPLHSSAVTLLEMRQA